MIRLGWVTLLLALLVGCQPGETVRPPKQGGAPHFDPDREPDAIAAAQLEARLGPLLKPRRAWRAGAVLKFLGNPYWQRVADGMVAETARLGGSIDIRASGNAQDYEGQLNSLLALVALNPDVIFISPLAPTNLQPGVEAARRKGIQLIVVNDDVLDDTEHFVGPNQYEDGVRAARYLQQRFPSGGDAAVIRGMVGRTFVAQRSQGFLDTLPQPPFRIVADVVGDWSLDKAMNHATEILHNYPTLVGFYCNSDVMALGVVRALETAGRTDIAVIGTDGLAIAYPALRAGTLSATIDTHPYEAGVIAVEVAVRLLAGQKVPRVVYSPQDTLTRETFEKPPK